MKTKVEYTWDDEDPTCFGKVVDGAFNRILNFCPELLAKAEKASHRTPEGVSFNRVTNGQFDMNDVRRLHGYAISIHNAVTKKYAGKSDDLSESVLQAAKNAVDVMAEVRLYVLENARMQCGLS